MRHSKSSANVILEFCSNFQGLGKQLVDFPKLAVGEDQSVVAIPKRECFGLVFNCRLKLGKLSICFDFCADILGNTTITLKLTILAKNRFATRAHGLITVGTST